MPGLVCPICFEYCFKSIGNFLNHIRLVHADSPNFQVHCGLQKCCRTFKNFKTYRNHVYSFHKDVEKASKDSTEDMARDLDSGMEIGSNYGNCGLQEEENEIDPHCYSLLPSPRASPKDFLQIQMAAAKWILRAREVNRLPISVVDGLLEDTQSLYKLALSHTRDRVANVLNKAGVQDSVISEIVTKELSDTSPVGILFSNQAKQMSFFTKHTVVCYNL